MAVVNKKREYFTQWSIKEALSIALIYFLLWILITFALSKVLLVMTVPAHASGDAIITLGSFSLGIICLIWLKLIKGGSLSTIGIVKCKLSYYLYALVCSVILYFVLKILFESLLLDTTPSFKEGYPIWRGLNGLVFVPIFEEVYFRGIFFSACREKFGLPVGAIMSAILFGLVHFNFHYPALWYISVGPPVLYGLTSALLFHYSKSLLPSMLCHSILNLLSI